MTELRSISPDLLIVRSFVGMGTRYVHIRSCGHADCEAHPELMLACVRRLEWGSRPVLRSWCVNPSTRQDDDAKFARGEAVYRYANDREIARCRHGIHVCSRCTRRFIKARTANPQ